MTPFIAELIGSALLILLGCGVNANVVLQKTKGHDSGWIVIAFGWAIAVFVAVFVAAPYSGAHINPAVTLGLALAGDFAWDLVPSYMAAQLIGCFVGATLVWLHYRGHFEATKSESDKLAVFSTSPAIRSLGWNTLSEIIGTFVLVFAVMHIASPEVGLGALDALPVGLVVLVIGLALGGPTGYAINPTRDLGPRLAHAVLPFSRKGSSDWSYAWVPILGPLAGGALAAIVFGWLG